MTDDIKDLLTLAVPDRTRLQASASPAADLARGQRSLRRRRLALVASAAVAVGAVAGGVASGAEAGSGTPAGASHPPVSAPASRPAQSGTGTQHPLALVAYGGAQPPGYQVAEVPAGWTIQGGNAYVLTLAPIGDPDTDVDSFAGKLVVMLESASDVPYQPGAAETVNGQPGRFWIQPDAETLVYRYTASTWVVIQAPSALGWDSAQLVQFAQGVTILGNAQQSHG